MAWEVGVMRAAMEIVSKKGGKRVCHDDDEV